MIGAEIGTDMGRSPVAIETNSFGCGKSLVLMSKSVNGHLLPWLYQITRGYIGLNGSNNHQKIGYMTSPHAEYHPNAANDQPSIDKLMGKAKILVIRYVDYAK